MVVYSTCSKLSFPHRAHTPSIYLWPPPSAGDREGAGDAPWICVWFGVRTECGTVCWFCRDGCGQFALSAAFWWWCRFTTRLVINTYCGRAAAALVERWCCERCRGSCTPAAFGEACSRAGLAILSQAGPLEGRLCALPAGSVGILVWQCLARSLSRAAYAPNSDAHRHPH